LASIKCFENLAPISKCLAKRYFKTLCVCPSEVSEKRFSPNGVFQKWIYENLVSKPLKNALFAKGFGLPNLKPTSKREIVFK
jgi:hypothetical protein